MKMWLLSMHGNHNSLHGNSSKWSIEQTTYHFDDDASFENKNPLCETWSLWNKINILLTTVEEWSDDVYHACSLTSARNEWYHAVFQTKQVVTLFAECYAHVFQLGSCSFFVRDIILII